MTSLAGANTLGVPADAQDVRRIEQVDDLRTALAEASGPQVLLGGGSNVVLGDHLDGTVLLMRIRGIAAEAVGETVHVTAGAGENWHGLVRWSLGRGLAGLENLALIPGSVGAAPVQNIGAYGIELAERFVGLEAMEVASGRIQRFTAAECAFGYRSSVFKREPGRFVILSVTLRLSDAAETTINTSYEDVAAELLKLGRSRPRPLDVAEAVVRVRRRKLPDPRTTPNVGSFFKNPVVNAEQADALAERIGGLKTYPDAMGIKLAAAQLIDRVIAASDPAWAAPDAPVRVWHRQPLVLTNPGRCSGTEVLATAAEIRGAVSGAYGVTLHLEPDLFGVSTPWA